jgi:tetratricopeptide (TPR) repeat protein
MKKSTEYTLVISSIIFCLLIFAGGFLYTHLKSKPSLEAPVYYPSKAGLKLTVANCLRDHQYSEVLSYLEGLTKTKDSQLLGQVNYCLAKVKYQRLNYLAGQSRWDEYHEYRKPYLSNILKETDLVLTALPATEEALEAGFLRYWVYESLYIDLRRDEAFADFKDQLDKYCQDNKEYAIIKEYALRLYQENKIQLAKELNSLYLRYLNQYLEPERIKYRLKSYANEVFEGGRHYAAKEIYHDYLKLQLKEDDDLGSQLAFKETIDKYLDKDRFWQAKEFAEMAVANYPQGYLSDYFQLKLAYSYFEMDEPEKSKKLYYKLLAEDPDSSYREETITTLAEEVMIYSFRDPEAAIEEIKGLQEYASDRETRASLLFYIADIYFLEDQFQEALIAYQDILTRYPDTNLILAAQNQIEKCKEKLKSQ